MRSPEQLRLLKAAVETDWRSAGEIQDRLEALHHKNRGKGETEERVAAAALWLHHFYNACENILKRIAEVFENEVGGEQWHWQLLERMRLDVPNVRPAVISEATRQGLDEYRRFRHLVRHSYGFVLEWEKMRSLLEGLGELSQRFGHELDDFLSWCDQLAEDLEGKK